MTAASRSFAVDTGALGSVLDVCAFIDALPRDAAGELAVFASDASTDGAVFVERGRVCWAGARGMSRRLSDLLAASANVDRVTMEAHYVRCARDGVPLGEHLVGSGIVTSDQLRAALLQHTSESLRALFRTPRRTGWVACRGCGYSARFTFATSELLARANAEDHREVARRASDELVDALDANDWGAGFSRSPARAHPDPISIAGACPDRVDVVLRLGRWASSALDVVGVAHADGAFVATRVRDGALVAWQHGATIIAARTGPYGPARLLNRRARARRKETPHGRV